MVPYPVSLHQKSEEIRWKYVSCSLQKFPGYNHHSMASYTAALQMSKYHAGKARGEQLHTAWNYEPSTTVAAAESSTVLSVDCPSLCLPFAGWQIVVCTGKSWLLTAILQAGWMELQVHNCL